MRLNLIAAIDESNAIGHANRLPWSLPGDLRRFRHITLGHCVIMGRATFDSLGRRPLPGRDNIVLTRSPPPAVANDCSELRFAPSVDEALALAQKKREVFFIGGAALYEQIIGCVERMFLTRVNHSFKADTWFPDFDPGQWAISAVENHWNERPLGWRLDQYDRLPEHHYAGASPQPFKPANAPVVAV